MPCFIQQDSKLVYFRLFSYKWLTLFAFELVARFHLNFISTSFNKWFALIVGACHLQIITIRQLWISAVSQCLDMHSLYIYSNMDVDYYYFQFNDTVITKIISVALLFHPDLGLALLAQIMPNLSLSFRQK